jgi:hypothetical protein
MGSGRGGGGRRVGRKGSRSFGARFDCSKPLSVVMLDFSGRAVQVHGSGRLDRVAQARHPSKGGRAMARHRQGWIFHPPAAAANLSVTESAAASWTVVAIGTPGCGCSTLPRSRSRASAHRQAIDAFTPGQTACAGDGFAAAVGQSSPSATRRVRCAWTKAANQPVSGHIGAGRRGHLRCP